MHHDPMNSAALTIAVALAAGMLSQALAHHLRVPGIVLLLAAGVLLGPEFADIVRPATLGHTLHDLVGFAVAVILFEGGMNLDLRRLRREGKAIRGLVTIGAVVTAVGGTLAARFLLGWTWQISALFGCLVIVTGPTVITPLLRRIRVQPKVGTVLEAEGVLGDAIGAIVAVVALEVVLGLSADSYATSAATGAWGLASRLGGGALVGLAAGFFMVGLLKVRRLVPKGYENGLILVIALALFQLCNAVLPESGIVAVTVAGFVVGNVHTIALPDIREFKEQLTVMFIGMLFVLLAADVQLARVQSLGLAGLATVAALMFVVRPLNVLAGTAGSDLTPKERGFIAWIAPRGIVAAAVASLFAQSLSAAGIEGGRDLRALVFLVIGVTVVVAGLTGGVMARGLGVARPSRKGIAILGANRLALELGRALQEGGREVVVIDSNPSACREAEDFGLRALMGSALDERIAMSADLDGRRGCIAATPNDGINVLFAKACLHEHGVPRAWVAIRRGSGGIAASKVEESGALVLFGEPRTLGAWILRLERNTAATEDWVLGEGGRDVSPDGLPESLRHSVLALAIYRKDVASVIDRNSKAKPGDRVRLLVFEDGRDEVHAWLHDHGWTAAPATGPDGSEVS